MHNDETQCLSILQVELGEMQHQILQLYSNKQRLQEGKSSTSKQKDRSFKTKHETLQETRSLNVLLEKWPISL